MNYIERNNVLRQIDATFNVFKIVCLLGPRQCGKTTLARQFWTDNNKTKSDPGYFDLEKPSDLQALQNPDLVLPRISGLIIIDEIQRVPNLFSYLRYLHDEEIDQKFLILGSASRELINQSAETLTGRIAFIEITPFTIGEVDQWQELWVRGGFPKSYLLEKQSSMLWRENYLRTYIEQDLALLGLKFQVDVLQRLWFMLAHYHGQIINYSEFAASLGISQPTVKLYISYLLNSFTVRLLKPWHENLQKRQVKSPKIYFRDSGLLHTTLGLEDYMGIMRHPKAGSSFEGFALEQVIHYAGVTNDMCYFWASHNQAELDLLILKHGKKIGFEFKMMDSPKITPSMRIVLKDLHLDNLTIIYPGSRKYMLDEKIMVLPVFHIEEFWQNLDK